MATPMKRGDFAFCIGLIVTTLATFAAPGGFLASFVIGAGAGVIAVGVTVIVLELVLKR